MLPHCMLHQVRLYNKPLNSRSLYTLLLMGCKPVPYTRTKYSEVPKKMSQAIN